MQPRAHIQPLPVHLVPDHISAQLGLPPGAMITPKAADRAKKQIPTEIATAPFRVDQFTGGGSDSGDYWDRVLDTSFRE